MLHLSVRWQGMFCHEKKNRNFAIKHRRCLMPCTVVLPAQHLQHPQHNFFLLRTCDRQPSQPGDQDLRQNFVAAVLLLQSSESMKTKDRKNCCDCSATASQRKKASTYNDSGQLYHRFFLYHILF